MLIKYDREFPNATGHYIDIAATQLGIEVITDLEAQADVILNIDSCSKYAYSREGVPSFYWETDSWYPRERILGFDKQTRIFYGGCLDDGIRYPANAIYLPLAADINLHRPIPVEKKYDIVMIGRTGGEYTERDRVINLLKSKYNIYVGETEAGIPYSTAMSKGKLILHRSVTDFNIGMRFFEGMAIGTLIANYIEGMNLLATPFMHYIPFRNDKELVENIDYYLSHPKEVNRIAVKSQALVMEKHTYINRLLEILFYL